MNTDSNTVTIVDYFVTKGGVFESEKVGEDIRVGNYPTSISLNTGENKIYIANSDSNSVSVINGQTNRLEGKPIEVGARPYGMLYYKDRLYVANFGSDAVSVVDPNQRKVVNTIPVGGLPVGLSVNPLTGVIYVTNLGSKTVSEIRDMSLLAGVNFIVNPTNSGHIESGRNKISDTRYTRYPVDEDIMCKAYAGPNSVFGSWTSDLPFMESFTGTE